MKDEPVYRIYPYPDSLEKVRVLPKDFSQNKGFRNTHLFGWDKFNHGTSKHITIVEGEEDALAAYEMLGSKYPVVALPGAGVSKALLEEYGKKLDVYSEIILCFDNDEAGEKARDKFVSLFPHKTSVVSLTKWKDASEIKQNDAKTDFIFAWHNRTKHSLDNVYSSKEDFTKILSEESTNDYVLTPFPSMNDMLGGLTRGHFYVLTAPEGQGKTEVLRAMEYHVAVTTEESIAVFHMEETKKTNLRTLACYALGKNCRDLDTKVPDKDIANVIEALALRDQVHLVDFTDDDPEKILDVIRFLHEVNGINYFFIDPIQQLAYGKDSEKTEEQVLSRLSVRLEKLCTDLNICVVCTAHVNDDGQTRSSRMIGKSASVRISLKRDHLNEDDEIRNRTSVIVEKNRPTSQTGWCCNLQFYPESFTISEV